MGARSSGWAAESWAVLAKDAAVELRTRVALTALGLFALTTLTIISYAVGPGATPPVAAALLWVVLFFAAVTGLARSFVAEEDGRTADLLRLAASPTAVFLGKLAFNLVLLWLLSVVLVPGFVVLMAIQVADPALLAAVVLLGGWGLAAVLTFTAALVARAQARSSLGAVLAFPLLGPWLSMAIGATAIALGGAGGGWGLAQGLFAYAGLITLAGLFLFDVVWQA